MKSRYKLLFSFLFVFLLVGFCFIASAHSGRTDDQGGHYSGSGYHYHHGYPAHDHTDGVCPYDFDDQTNTSQSSTTSLVKPDIKKKAITSSTTIGKITKEKNASSSKISKETEKSNTDLAKKIVSTPEKAKTKSKIWIKEYNIFEAEDFKTSDWWIAVFIICLCLGYPIFSLKNMIQNYPESLSWFGIKEELRILSKYYNKKQLLKSFVKSTLAFLISLSGIGLLWYFKPIPFLPIIAEYLAALLFFDHLMFGRRFYVFILTVIGVVLYTFSCLSMFVYSWYFNELIPVLHLFTVILFCSAASVNLNDLTEEFWLTETGLNDHIHRRK